MLRSFTAFNIVFVSSGGNDEAVFSTLLRYWRQSFLLSNSRKRKPVPSMNLMYKRCGMVAVLAGAMLLAGKMLLLVRLVLFLLGVEAA